MIAAYHWLTVQIHEHATTALQHQWTSLQHVHSLWSWDSLLLLILIGFCMNSLLRIACWEPTIITKDLVVLTDNRLLTYHSSTLVTHFCNGIGTSLTLLPIVYKHASSPNILLYPSLMASQRSFIKTRKRNCPKIEPWGTPISNSTLFESFPLQRTACYLSCK